MIHGLTVQQESSLKFAGEAFGVFFIYLLISLMLFGWPVLGSFSSSYIGTTTDPGILMWSFEWCTYAIAHWLNIFHPTIVWAPTGCNLALVTFAPGLAFLASPINLLA